MWFLGLFKSYSIYLVILIFCTLDISRALDTLGEFSKHQYSNWQPTQKYLIPNLQRSEYFNEQSDISNNELTNRLDNKLDLPWDITEPYPWYTRQIYFLNSTEKTGKSIFYNKEELNSEGSVLITDSNVDTIQVEWARHYASGLAPANDYTVAGTLDTQGNIYVTGNSSNLYNGYNIVTIKYSQNGEKLWETSYNGGGDGDDFATSIAVDIYGNVYVTGYSQSLETLRDYITIKYDADGNQKWATRYNGPGNSDDEVSDIAVDKTGNVYVTGGSKDLKNSYDYATIKYDANGNQIWISRYNGTGDSTDYARSIAIDESGNVYVTGESFGTGTYNDYATIKYDSNGNEMWTARFNSASNHHDQARDIAVGSSGNVYVTGYSWILGNNRDCITIKYDTTGNQLWVAQYNGSGNGKDVAVKISIDTLENIYITGSTYNSNDDCLTIKYDSNGNQVWLSTYDGYWDFGNNITIDTEGSVYITGTIFTIYGDYRDFDCVTIKYDKNGNQIWVARYGGSTWDETNTISVDEIGNVYVTGKSENSLTYSDYLVIKYNSTGTKLWSLVYNGAGNFNDAPIASAIDKTGNIYVVGRSVGTASNNDFVTIKYDKGGNQLWIRRYNGDSNASDTPSAMTVDESGNVYVTGTSNYLESIIIKYDTNGNQLWLVRYGEPGHSDNRTKAIAVDASKNIYVTGSISSFNTISNDFATAKYDSNGNQQWISTYNGPGTARDIPSAMALDSYGNVYVTGTSVRIVNNYGNGDFATIKYDASGNQLWVSRYDGDSDSPNAITVDNIGNVYVTGRTGNFSFFDYATVKYDSTGNQLWIAKYNGPGRYDAAHDIVVDATGNVYVTGVSESEGSSSQDYTTVKYDSNGNRLWVKRYDGYANSYNFARAITIDKEGNVYVTGGADFENGNYSAYKEITTIKYDANGNQIWLAKYNGPGNSLDWDYACDVIIDSLHNVYVVGASGYLRSSMITTIKYTRKPTSVEERPLDVPFTHTLHQNYPNPFNPSTAIEFELRVSSNVELTIYNILGQEVATLINETLPSGNYKLTWEANGAPSGVYYYRLHTGNFTQLRKMVLIR